MKTAVEWLEDQIKNSKYFYKLMEDINSRSTIAQSNIFQKAKEIEKKQIVLSHINGQSEFDKEKFREYNKDLAQAYYNQTYKSKEQ